MHWIERCFILLLIPLAISAQNCKQYESCGACMSDASCQWCSDLEKSGQRCLDASAEDFNCASLVSVENEEDIQSNLDLDNSILIQPQVVNLELRPGLKHDLEFTIGQSDEYPVDIYFLFDLSRSMNDSRNNFAEQGAAIIDSIKEITDDVQIGFGSFVDKNLPPFASTNPKWNCPASFDHCIQPYSFCHQVTLGQLDAEKFKTTIKGLPISGNVDDPEGALEALLQAMLCKSEIGWRDSSRKIILVATDRDYHNALDGKLAGILFPNDGKCHLGSDSCYSESQHMDYPSVSQINYVAHQDSFLLIFAISQEYFPIYNALSGQIRDSRVAILKKDASNIVQIISDSYNQVVTNVEVKAINLPKDISIDFQGSCGNSNRCNVSLGESVDFTASIELIRCLPAPVQFSISPVGLGQQLTVNVKSLCECPCEIQGNPGFEEASPKCQSNGDLACGICKCQEGFSGNQCECDESKLYDDSGNDDLNANCKDEDSENPDLICSGRGSCNCGVCICNTDPRGAITGKFCQCDNFSCLRGSNDQVCSGNGICECGACKCEKGWAGDDCSCSTSTNLCNGPYSLNICSGHGKCQCNKCICDTDTSGAFFTGKYCEQFPNEGGPCKILAPHVSCRAFEDEECSKPSVDFGLIMVNHTNPILNDQFFCEAQNAKGCTFRFSPILEGALSVYFHVIEGKLEFDCPQSLGLIVSGSIFGLILLAGVIALLIWKCYIVIQDRREYARFLEEKNTYNFASNENPLHKSPITQYQNPAWEGNKKTM